MIFLVGVITTYSFRLPSRLDGSVARVDKPEAGSAEPPFLAVETPGVGKVWPVADSTTKARESALAGDRLGQPAGHQWWRHLGDEPLHIAVGPVPEVVLSDEQRWHQVEQLLHGDTIRLQARVAGLFALLFAQPLRRTLRIRIDQITATPNGAVTVSFDTVAIELPDLVDDLVRRQLTRAQTARPIRANDGSFPGGNQADG